MGPTCSTQQQCRVAKSTEDTSEKHSTTSKHLYKERCSGTAVERNGKLESPGLDEVHAFWIKNFTKLHGRIAKQLQQCLTGGNVPEWLVLGRINLAMKDETKGAEFGNYRPIACLPTTFKLLTGIIAEHIYRHLDRNGLLLDEQKGCRRKT